MLPGPSILQKSTSSFHEFASLPPLTRNCTTWHSFYPNKKHPQLFSNVVLHPAGTAKREVDRFFLPPDGFVLPKKFSQSLSSHSSQVISLKQKSQVISRLSLSQATNTTRCIPAVMPISVVQRWSNQHLFHVSVSLPQNEKPWRNSGSICTTGLTRAP